MIMHVLRKLHLTSLPTLFISMVFLVSCSGNNNESKHKTQPDKESLLKVNKTLVKSEGQKIEDFILRYNWQMQKSGTGLRYMIYEEGNGPEAENGRIAMLSFQVSLLDGTVCYSSEMDGPKEFQIGKGGVESGLEEGILLLKEGDRAKFIIPSHLAFGLLGDMNKIPAKAALVYDVKLLKIK